MRVNCQKALFLVALVAIGCRDSTSGPSQSPSTYVLTTINGRRLPTFYSPIPEDPTIVGGSLFLNGAGLATVDEQRRDINGNVSTYKTTYRYLIIEDTIQFDYYPSCPPFALCIRLPKGKLAGGHALIDFSGGEGLLIFDYAFLGLD